ncbi:MAG: TIGR00701 family protein [Gammaproteobacteria bacterium]|nr:TIGR00701 family protein [Gammaproteobacteria bacterium]
MEEHEPTRARLEVMERRLFGLMTLGGVATAVFGFWLLFAYWVPGLADAGWLHVKLALVAVLAGYHGWCARIIKDFREGRNRHGHVFYRWFNEFPSIVLVVVVILAAVKPF